MRKALFICASFCLLFTAGRAQSKQETKVAAAAEALKEAMVSGERQALEDIAAGQLSYGHSSGKIEDKAAFVEAIASGKSDFVEINISDQTIAVSGKTAMVRHKLSARTNDGGRPGTVNLGILLVFGKQHGQWKLLGRQAYKI